MALEKNFLRIGTDLKISSLVTCAIVSLPFSYYLYLFFVMFKETFRFFTSQYGGRELLVLTPAENYFSNLFLASISSVIGFYMMVRVLMQIAPRTNVSKIVNRRQFRVHHEIDFFGWFFMHAFAKFGACYGILLYAFSLHFEFSLLREFSLLLILIPIVMFSNIWISLERLLGVNSRKWKIGSIGLIITQSLVFSLLSPLDVKAINNNLLTHNIRYRYDLQVPAVDFHDGLKNTWQNVDLYVAYGKSMQALLLFYGDSHDPIDKQQLIKKINDYAKYHTEFGPSDLTINLHIDNEIEYKDIRDLVEFFRAHDCTNFQFSIGLKHSRYPNHYPGFRNLGIPHRTIPLFSEKWLAMMDSLDEVVNKNHSRIELPNAPYCRIAAFHHSNRISVDVSHDTYSLNGKQTKLDDMEQILKRLVDRCNGRIMIGLKVEDSVSYDQYIQMLSMLYKVAWNARPRYVSNKSCDEMGFDLRKEVDSSFPVSIVEWSSEELRMMDLLSKFGNVKYLPPNEDIFDL